MKKGDTSIALIVSIIITVVGIGLVLTQIPKAMNSQDAYCTTVHKLKGGLWWGKKDTLCQKNATLEVTPMEKKLFAMNAFDDNNAEKSFLFETLKMQGTLFNIPGNALIKNANFMIGIGSQKINQFTMDYDVSLKEKETLNFPKGGGNRTFRVKIPKSAKVTNAKFRLTGINIPGKADIVFIIDSSTSMGDEWDSVCRGIGTIVNDVKKTTDLEASVYSLDTFYAGLSSTECNSLSGGVINSIKPIDNNSLSLYFSSSCSCTDAYECHFYGSNYPNPFDQWEESWGLGLEWLTRGNHNFRPNSKRLIIPISDSDPTGGGVYTFVINGKNQIYPPSKHFSGNEDCLILNIKNYFISSKQEYIFPVIGNCEKDEGYGVGCEPCGDNCTKVINWMNDLANSTGGSVNKYVEQDLLIRALKNAINTTYPENVEIKINNTRIFYQQEELNTSNSPRFVEFEKTLNDYLRVCATDPCEVSIVFSLTSEGSLFVDSFFIDYELKPADVKAGVDNFSVQLGALDFSDVKEINLTQGFKNYLTNCTKETCSVPLNISVENRFNGTLKISNVDIQYEVYPVVETLVQKILECWDKGERGKKKDNIYCGEFVLPKNYKFYSPITEQNLTKEIIDRNLCQIFGNNNYLNCGTSDSLSLTKNINSVTNILIEYNSEKKQVIVS